MTTKKTVPSPLKPKAKGPRGMGRIHQRSELASELGDMVHQLINPLYERVSKIEATGVRPTAPLINILIPQIMKDIEPLAKTHYNEEGGFNFRMIDEMTAPLSKIFSERGVFVAPVDAEVVSTIEKQALTTEGRPYILFYTTVRCRYQLTASDGSFVPLCALGKGMSDMHFDVASAQTMAFKQMLWQTFMIPVLGNIDPEQEGTRATALPVTETTAPTRSVAGEQPQPSLFGEPLAVADSSPTEEGKPARRKKEKAEKAPDTKMSPGTLNIVNTHLVQSGRPLAALLEHFKIEVLEDLNQSQMSEVLAWIKEGEA